MIALSLCIHATMVAKGFCSCDLSVESNRGIYDWQEGVPGQEKSQMCQYGIVGQYVTRRCNETLAWSENNSMCPSFVTDQINRLNTAIINVKKC